MPYGDTPFVADTVMTKAAIDAELAEARTWLNGRVVAGDIADASVGHEHIRRPYVLGFPTDGFEGSTQSIVSTGLVVDGVALDPEQSTAILRCDKSRRFDIFHATLGNVVSTPIIGMVKSINCYTTGRLIIEANWSAVSAFDSQASMPNVPAVGDAFGYFVVSIQRRTTGTGTALNAQEMPHTARLMRAKYGRRMCTFNVLGSRTVDVANIGEWDVWVAYNKTDHAEATQGMVSIGYRNFRVEFEPD